jgi:methylmalonyl-CoA/ethylmalonyl-CoA epimerase
MPARVRLEHIAIAVPRLEDALAALARVLPAPAGPPEEVPTEKVRVAMLDVGGAHLELVEGTSPESPVSRFLASGKSGVHHLSFVLEGVGLAEWCEELERRGVEVLGRPRPGVGGRQVVFVHPRSTAGILVEFSEAPGGPR